ncbi:hypothetical protein BT96DRAFT_920501 [Gymnopus androsaceus JB14]|uniref:Uncharacterized protein n=1 Tax=Gymnopus androsaceus JB14 TaxID=1447944 RepID=A0A6A4HPF0_9AGAR|nr:hypothetical protein BT96DRAFT_920501 [Gymnopus androsaceus JB14]
MPISGYRGYLCRGVFGIESLRTKKKLDRNDEEVLVNGWYATRMNVNATDDGYEHLTV